jgi:hypothetical protein
MSSIHGKYVSPRKSMGRRSTNEIGRKAANDWLTLRTDQFHLAFTIHVATAKSTPPIAMLVKNSQFVT